jgi:alkanesulfonate monooxygenase
MWRADQFPVYSTAPRDPRRSADQFGGLTEVARWSEAAGLRGMLIFTDNNSVDPWVIAQYAIERTERLVPLVAVNPEYQDPVSAARMVLALARLRDRGVDLNLVTGSYRPDLRALGCTLDHDRRYDRLVAFGEVMATVLAGASPAAHRSDFYDVRDVAPGPALPRHLTPRVFVAGSSPAAAAAAGGLRAVRLANPRPPDEYDPASAPLAGTAIRIGVLARESHDEAWLVAHERYGTDPTRETFINSSVREDQAHWMRSMFESPESGARPEPEVYWSHPFRVSREYCAYLVGDYAAVGDTLARYRRLGVNALVLSRPSNVDDLHHAMAAVAHADRRLATEPAPSH